MTYDYAIVGAGVFGLALARELAGAGQSLILLDETEIGGTAQNASAGLLGALMPASPLINGPLAQVQRQCLLRYPDRIAQLEPESGLHTGYKRARTSISRVQPILTAAARQQFERQAEASRQTWQALGGKMDLLDAPALAEQVPPLAACLADAPFGYAVDNVSAQIAPRSLLAALSHSLAGAVTLQPHTRVLRIGAGEIVTAGQTYQAKTIIVTAGWQTGALVPQAPVVGVKGQACAIAPMLMDVPMLYTRNGYVVFHDEMTALGSTTEKQWTDVLPDVASCHGIQQRLADMMPMLAGRPVTECWAGVRPKADGALPFVRQAAAGVIVATGGYKIGLALGFEMAAWIAAALAEDAVDRFWDFVATRASFDFSDYA